MPCVPSMACEPGHPANSVILPDTRRAGRDRLSVVCYYQGEDDPLRVGGRAAQAGRETPDGRELEPHVTAPQVVTGAALVGRPIPASTLRPARSVTDSAAARR
jgi:hypothetical protein